MNKTMKTLRTLILPALLVLGTITIGCDSGISGAETDEPTLKFSGEEVLRGLVFGEGPVADLFPELWNKQALADALAQLSPEDRAAYHADMEKMRVQLDDMLTELRTEDAGFLDRFGTALQSGNHVQIERALEEAKTALVAAAGRAAGLSEEAIAAQQAQLNGDPEAVQALGGQGLIIVFPIMLACYFDLVVPAPIVLACYIAWFVSPQDDRLTRMGKAGLAEAGLERDRYINLVAGRL